MLRFDSRPTYNHALRCPHLAMTPEEHNERLLRTAFCTLWLITVSSVSYGIAAEMFGLSIFQPSYPYKYNLSVEYHVLGTVTSIATLMLAVTTVAVWRSAPRLRKLGIVACILQLFYISMPRY